jgi:hypothetical protein
MAFGLDDIVATGLKIIDKFIPDPAEKAKAESELRSWLGSLDLAQMEVNKAEAESASVFKGGWRPFVGWVCGAAFAMHFLLFPIVNYTLVISGIPPVVIPFDMQTLMSVLMGMLGMGGLRTYEKMKGVASK